MPSKTMHPRGNPNDCPACGTIGGHTPEVAAECWQGRARMAKAKRDTGGALSALEIMALDKFPDPPFLGQDGYR